MTDTEADELKVKIVNLEAEVTYWRDRCANYEAQFIRIHQAAGDIKGRVEQFFIVLDAIKLPQGTDRRA